MTRTAVDGPGDRSFSQVMASGTGIVGKGTQIDQLIYGVASADPKKVQEIAAAQLGVSASYYRMVLAQASRSFAAAVVAGVVGLTFLIASISFVLASGKAATAPALISAMSGAIVEGIAGLNFWLFGRTASQLNTFHVRLDRTQRYLLANSICEQMQAQSGEATRAELVKTIASDTSS